MSSLFTFNQFPFLFFLIGYGMAAVLGLVSFKPKPSYPLFLGLALLLLAYMRLPVIFYNRELNVDEGQMLTQAMTLMKDPVYWRSVDGTTGGPLGSYFLLIPALLTGNFSYMTGHLGAVLLLGMTFVFLSLALKNWFGTRVSQLISYPVLLFYAFTQLGDFVHYSSELVPVTLLSSIVYLFSTPGFLARGTYRTSILLGVLFLAMPFGKIQSLPLLAACLGYYLYSVYIRNDFRPFVACVVSGLSALLVLVLVLWVNDVLDDFLFYYIHANFNYGEGGSWGQNLLNLPAQFSVALDYTLILLPLALGAVLAIFRWGTLKKDVFFFSLALLIMGILAVSRTGTGYTHYLFFLVIPFILLSASLLGAVSSLSWVSSLTLTGASLACLVGLMLVHYKKDHTLNYYVSTPTYNRTFPISPVGAAIDQYKQAGDYLVVWGWNCQYYIETQLPQGVAENHTIRSSFEHPLRETYRKRFMENMQRNRPAVVVDAVGKNSYWMQDPATQSYESFPELKAYLERQYVWVGTVDGVRIFVRADRSPKQLG